MRPNAPFRDPGRARELLERIHAAASRPWEVMEVCGGQTHALLRHGLDRLLAPSVTLHHGPGCPVCVTPAEVIDHAVALAQWPGTTVVTYGDMLRVPGARGDLASARAAGADVRAVYSPLDALAVARARPDREVVFLAVGFETTAPANALAVLRAAREGLENFSVLAAHVRVPPALDAVLDAPGSPIRGFLAAGHVCAVMGTREYDPVARRHGVPVVVTGFEPVDLLRGVLTLVEELEAGRSRVRNAYGRVVRPEGNPHARRVVDEVFEIADRPWRGIGVLPRGGLALRPRWSRYDAARRFPSAGAAAAADTRCRAGDVLRGVLRPDHCPEFGAGCTPDRPLGPPMVSGEGACAAYWRYRRPRAPSRQEGAVTP